MFYPLTISLATNLPSTPQNPKGKSPFHKGGSFKEA
jgi:hypothetical protein